MAVTILEAEQLSVHSDATRLLHNIQLSLKQGEMVGLVGPNGAGKTTLLRALMQLTPYTGRVNLSGAAMQRIARVERARRVAYLPQGHEVHWAITALRLVQLGRFPWGRSPWSWGAGYTNEVDEAAVADAMRACDVHTLGDRVVNSLSGGEKVRVHLARVLAGRPELILADEPIASLDPYHQLRVMQLLKTITTQDSGVLVVLHDLTLAARFCDRLLLLHQGEIVAAGLPATVLSEENIAQTFHVDMVRGTHLGQDYLLPWSTIKSF